MRWCSGAAQKVVQVETHRQGGQTLHVGAVDELLPTDDVRLEETRRRQVTSDSDVIAPLSNGLLSISLGGL